MGEFRKVEYRHDDTTLIGEALMPAGPGPHPGLLVMYDALGVSDMIRRRARELAAKGYAVLLTDMYGGGLTEDSDHNHAGFAAMQADRPRLRGRALAGLAALRGLAGVDGQRIGAIGYCFGGQCVLEIARSGADLQAVVSFHGLLTTHAPAQAGRVPAKVLVITGALDPYAPISDLHAFETEMAEAAADWQVTVYGTGYHAFTDPDIARRTEVPGIQYDPLLDRMSWAQCTTFLDALVPA
jgi:dienelactone hydrolase